MREWSDAPLFLTNGKVWTGQSLARSVTVRGGRISAVDGTPPAGAAVLDLGGRLVVPGLVDNHVHFVTGSRQLAQLPLREAGSAELFAARIAERARAAAPGEWITGGGWDEQSWLPPVPPTRELIDDVTPANPLFVTRLDLHMGLANGRALERAGITSETPDPPGGTITRDERGRPTGILKDAAMRLVSTLIPPPDQKERLAAMRRGLREAARLGVTAFCDMGMSEEAFDDFRAWQALERSGELTARVFMYLPIASWERLRDAGVERGFGSSRLRVAGLKGFSDGSLGSSTAAFHEAFSGEPHNCGLLMKEMLDGSLGHWIAGADAARLQLAIHAIGDRANSEVLSLFEALPAHAERRLRVEHAQHLSASLVRRFAAGRFVAAAQPYHAADDGRWASSKIGERERWAFPFRSLLDAGAVLTFGSDWPVAPLDPLAGIHAAVTRRTVDGRHPEGWIPQEKITVTEALAAYTRTGAWGVFAEGELGTIAPGMRADLAVLSDDVFTIDPERISSVSVELTVFDGRVIYRGGEFAAG